MKWFYIGRNGTRREGGGLTEQTYNVCDSLTEGRRKKKARTRVTLVGSRFCWKSLEGSIEKRKKNPHKTIILVPVHYSRRACLSPHIEEQNKIKENHPTNYLSIPRINTEIGRY